MRLKKTLIIILTVIAMLAVLTVFTPLEIDIGAVVVHRRGIHPVFIILLIIVMSIVEIFACALALLPVYTSMTVECDPKKFIALNEAFSKPGQMPAVYAMGYTFLGEFAAAEGYASQMVATGKPDHVIAGLFNRARCEFLMGDREALFKTAAEYGAAADRTKKSGKRAEQWRHLRITVELMCAIAEGDKEKIDEYRSAVTPWEKTASAECYVNYLKGIAAQTVGDGKECVYRLMLVRNNCPKTVFAWLADECMKKSDN